MPTLNPDGFENKDISGNWDPTRFNSNNIDLNRDFPDQYIGNGKYKKQPETEAILKWYKDKQ